MSIIIYLNLYKSFRRSTNFDKGRIPEYPRYFRKMEEKLAREQRKLSGMKKFSKNWYKQKLKIAKIHEKIANMRKDFLANFVKISFLT